jgi:hypothetical protein
MLGAWSKSTLEEHRLLPPFRRPQGISSSGSQPKKHRHVENESKILLLQKRLLIYSSGNSRLGYESDLMSLAFLTASTPWVVTLVSSELFLIVIRSGDITVLAKNETQRSPDEQTKIARGLFRSLVLELFLFVPASAALLLLIFPPLVAAKVPFLMVSPIAFYAMLGIISYGFPFAAFRQIVTRVALNTLKEFAQLQSHEDTVGVSVVAATPRKARSVQD